MDHGTAGADRSRVITYDTVDGLLSLALLDTTVFALADERNAGEHRQFAAGRGPEASCGTAGAAASGASSGA
jgi:hypothetical protein